MNKVKAMVKGTYRGNNAGFSDMKTGEIEELAVPERELLKALEQFRGPAPDTDLEQDKVTDAEKHTVDKLWFNSLVGFLVFGNMIYIGMEQDYGVKFTEEDILYLSTVELVQKRSMWFIIENVFCLVFVSELVLRIRTHGNVFFYNATNCADSLLVFLAVVDTYIVTFVSPGNSNLRAISALRVFRLIRLINYVKNSRAFREIWLIISSFANSVKALAWVGLLMFFLLYMVSILMTMYIGQNDEVYGTPPPLPEVMWPYKTYFGTIPRSMFTLFQVLTLDNWCDNIVRHVSEKQPLLAILFVLYIFLASFGMLNVIIGIIVENTLFVARQQDEAAVKRKEADSSKTLGEIRELFYLSDTDGSNTLSLSEFTAAFESRTVRKKFQEIGLPVNDALEIFTLMDPMKRGFIYLEDFLSSCSLMIGGTGMSKSVAQIAMQIDTLSRRMDYFNTELEEMESSIDNLVNHTAHFLQNTLPLLTGLTVKDTKTGKQFLKES